MKSKITIEVDFENGNRPVIQVLSRQSDDVRDNLISSFLQSLGHTSRWAAFKYKGEQGVSYPGSESNNAHCWIITPLTPAELPEEIKLMEATIQPEYKTKPGMIVTDDLPRRIRLDLNTPAELAIRNAMKEIEKMEASTLLTDAVVLLGQALNLVADYIDTSLTP